MYAASSLADKDFVLDTAFFLAAFFFVDGVVVDFFFFVGGMDGEDGEEDGGSTVSIIWDDDAFLDLFDLVSGAGDSGSGFFFGPFFAFVDAMIALRGVVHDRNGHGEVSTDLNNVL